MPTPNETLTNTIQSAASYKDLTIELEDEKAYGPGITLDIVDDFLNVSLDETEDTFTDVPSLETLLLTMSINKANGEGLTVHLDGEILSVYEDGGI